MLVSNIKHDLVVVSSQELFYNFPELHSETGWSTCTRCTEAGAVVITGPPPPRAPSAHILYPVTDVGCRLTLDLLHRWDGSL